MLFSKAITLAYYGVRPVYNYWNGCSTGGRQGYLLAQELGKELDGILANAPAIYWTRFQTAQMWGQILMKDLLGGPMSAAKFSQATTSAVAACDAADGVTDGGAQVGHDLAGEEADVGGGLGVGHVAEHEAPQARP